VWLNILVMSAAIGLVVRYVLVGLGLPSWSYYVTLIALAAMLYFMNVSLIRRYIEQRTPDLASTEEVAPGVQAWELTAGVGIVPKWVSLLGLAALACLVALAMPFLAGLMRC
jgi:hypothetical protein